MMVMDVEFVDVVVKEDPGCRVVCVLLHYCFST